MRPSATHAITRILHEEHDRHRAVLQAMRQLVRSVAGGARAPGCKVFRAMLLYIVDYPEKLHHPSEERLFALLQLRTESVNDEITRLREQHIRGEAMVRALEHKLTQYELDRGAGFPPFAKAAEEYIRFSLDHMRLEEQAVLPAAESCLTEPDWAAADLSFGANQGARGGLADKQSFDNLFSLIVNTAPANRGGAEELKPLLRQ